MGICIANVLAGPTRAPDVCMWYFSWFECEDVAVQRDLWPVLAKHLLAMWVNLALENHFAPGPFKAEVKATDACEE